MGPVWEPQDWGGVATLPPGPSSEIQNGLECVKVESPYGLSGILGSPDQLNLYLLRVSWP